MQTPNEATVKYIRITPRKLGVVADAVRGKSVKAALNYLALSPRRRVAGLIAEAIKSASANTLQKGTVDQDNLIVHHILVCKGPTIKRFMTRAKGSASRILKYTSHLKVSVTEGAPVKSAKRTAGKAPKAAKKGNK
ncbi:MAG: 50S ribosomal protein L22 [Bdellovibrionales bacterium]|nr:50S ribosomal protein L22 [Bdellovibrionales bacterium]